MRITRQSTTDAIKTALGWIDEPIRDLLAGVHFFSADPIAAGISPSVNASFGRSYRDTAHVLYPWVISRPYSEKLTTVVLPTVDNDEAWIVVHELGHVLDERTGFQFDLEPVNDYAASDRYEAFAEAFRFYCQYGDRGRERIGRKSIEVFDRLAQR